MKIIGALALILSLYPAYSQSIPPDRLPPAGYWNPGCIGTNGETYRQAGTFIPPVALTNIINVKNPPYNAVGDGVHDDTTNIQAAIAAGANSIIYLPTGIYKVTGQLELANPNYPWGWSSKILRGDGPTNTFIKSYAPVGPLIDASASEPGTERAVYLAQTAPRGTNTIVLSGWDSGGFFDSQNWGILYESNNVAGPPWSYGQPYTANSKCQIIHILSRNATTHTITFDPPAYFNWDTNTMFTIFYGSDSSVGIENLSIENCGGTDTHNIQFSGIFNSWIRNIESKNAYGWHIRLQDCARCTICDSYIHGYFPTNGVGGGNSVYGAGIYGQSSDNLVINNVFDHCRHAMIVEYGDIGNVFAYNYNQNPINEGQEETDYLMGDMIQHGSTAFNLWEGNIAADFRMDDVISGSVDNTAFRDNMTRQSIPTVNSGQWGYDIQVSNYWVSIIGCVMNSVGYNPTWRVGAPDANGDYPSPANSWYPFTVNSNDVFANSLGTAGDPSTTLLVDGTVDLQNNLIQGATTNFFALSAAKNYSYPASLWLTNAPAFWTPGLPWPAIGPDVSGYVKTIPAEARFAALNQMATNLPAPPSNLQIIN
ncbi:MAG TPA: glycosyl hydrolase family 28-related protein [Verrucomicrobiae bacterium]|nr:glycosyl hydrolase family 28-related protein [Verrucomicrobiae bacterium]